MLRIAPSGRSRAVRDKLLAGPRRAGDRGGTRAEGRRGRVGRRASTSASPTPRSSRPRAGVITERAAEPGEVLPPGAPALGADRPRPRPWLTVYVDEPSLARVRLGDTVDGQGRRPQRRLRPGGVSFVSPRRPSSPRRTSRPPRSGPSSCSRSRSRSTTRPASSSPACRPTPTSPRTTAAEATARPGQPQMASRATSCRPRVARSRTATVGCRLSATRGYAGVRVRRWLRAGSRGVHSTTSPSRGEVVGLIGPDGAGKTSTLRVVAGLLRADAADRRRCSASTAWKHRRALHRRLGYLAQRFALYGDLTVDENVQFFALLYGVRGWRDAPCRCSSSRVGLRAVPRPPGRPAVGRDEAEARAGLQPDARPRGAAARRADHRRRPGHPARVLAPARRPGRRGADPAGRHSLPRRGRALLARSC